MEHDNDVKYQNHLIHQRLTWLGTFEGLLFVANHYTEHTYLLPLVGLAIAISVGLGTHAANQLLTKLKAQAYADWRNYLMPGSAIPTIIAAAWIVIICENVRHSALLFCRS
jgi:hypothetical protein